MGARRVAVQATTLLMTFIIVSSFLATIPLTQGNVEPNVEHFTIIAGSYEESYMFEVAVERSKLEQRALDEIIAEVKDTL